MRRWLPRLLIAAIVVAAVVAFFTFDLSRFFTLHALKGEQHALKAWQADHPWLLAGGFFLAYVAITAASVPGAAIATIAAGALFGLLEGTVLVSFASSIGATLAFIASRFVFRDAVRRVSASV